MLADMRGQFFSMLADAGFAARPQHSAATGGFTAAREGADDPAAPYNRHADRPAVVRARRSSEHFEYIADPSVVAGAGEARTPPYCSSGRACCHQLWSNPLALSL